MEKWIPMDEKTPEYNENVLFQAKSDGHMYVGYYTKYGARCITARKSFVTGMKPVAWMPLPERYTE